MEKKKGKKRGGKKRRGAEHWYRTRELRLHSLMVSPPTPQRHELGNRLQFFQTKTNQALAGTLDQNQDNFSTLKPRDYAYIQTYRRSVFFYLHVAIRNSLRSNKKKFTTRARNKVNFDARIQNKPTLVLTLKPSQFLPRAQGGVDFDPHTEVEPISIPTLKASQF